MNTLEPTRNMFYDGILTIIQERKETKAEVIYLDAEYDKPITLETIKAKYPNVSMVIFEMALQGWVFRYGNHGEKWEQVGTTVGYA